MNAKKEKARKIYSEINSKQKRYKEIEQYLSKLTRKDTLDRKAVKKIQNEGLRIADDIKRLRKDLRDLGY